LKKGLKSISTPTALEIAKKHGVSLEYIAKQIAKGVKVEKEHTRSAKEANEIARDHLGERPDYYTKLHKMEKTKVKLNELGEYDNKGGSPIVGDLTGSSRKVMKVDEIKLPKVPEKIKTKTKKAIAVGMTAANLATGADIYDRASRGVGSPVRDVAAAASGLPGKVGYAAMGTNYTIKGFDKAREHLRQKEKLKEDLRKWFREKWVRYDTKGNIKGPCARDEGEGKPKCRPLASARAMSKDERAKSARRKRREDPVADRPGKGGKPIMVRTEETLLEKNVPTNPSLWAKAKAQAKSKFDVYPSAYANGWASKWYKSKGGGWKTAANESIEEACWDTHRQEGMKKKGGKMVPNCVPKEEKNIVPANTTERGIYEGDPMKDAEDKIKNTFTADKVKGMFKRVDKERDKDPKWVAYKKRKQQSMKEEQIDEMDTSSQRPSTNIIDRRPGLSPQGIGNAVSSFKQNMAMRQSGTARQPEVGGANIPKQTPAQSAIGAARDAVRGMGQNVRDKLGLDLDKGPSTVARTAARTVAPVSTAIAGAVADRMSANKPSVNLSKLPASKASPASIPTVGGASPPSLEGGATRQARQSPTTRNSPDAPTTPQNATREGGIDIDALERDITSKTPSDGDVKFDQQIKKGRINEISAELVGKVSNARFFRGETPSKTLTRAINKKFIESGKKDKGKANKDKKDIKEELMDTKELIHEAIGNIMEENLHEMKDNFLAVLQEKAIEKLEERKKIIAANYFGQ